MPISPEQMGFCAAAQIVRIHRHFTECSSGKESDDVEWTIENGNHYVRDRTYDEDRCQVRNPNSAQILATLRSLARFLAKKGVHRPRSAHQKTTPALNRFCQYHRTLALRWLTT